MDTSDLTGPGLLWSSSMQCQQKFLEHVNVLGDAGRHAAAAVNGAGLQSKAHYC